MEEEVRLRAVVPGTDISNPSAIRAMTLALAEAGLAVRPEAAPTTSGTKGEGIAAALLLKTAETALGKAIEVLAGLFTRPGAPPAEIEIETPKGKAHVKFDPRTLKPEQIPALVEALGHGLRKA